VSGAGKMIAVRAGDGLVVHLPKRLGCAPGARTRVITATEIVEVPSNSRFVRRRILVGDLVVVQPGQMPARGPDTEE
jgi:hypothetical protein